LCEVSANHLKVRELEQGGDTDDDVNGQSRQHFIGEDSRHRRSPPPLSWLALTFVPSHSVVKILSPGGGESIIYPLRLY